MAESLFAHTKVAAEMDAITAELNVEREARLIAEDHVKVVDERCKSIQHWIDEHDFATLEQKVASQSSQVLTEFSLVSK